MNALADLNSLSGVVHRIERRGIYTDGVFRPFKYPIIDDIEKSRTSPSGIFITLIIHGKLYLVTISQSELSLENVSSKDAFYVDTAFNNEESFFITLANDSCFHIYELYPPLKICSKYANIPVTPISFTYYQIHNAIKVTIEGNDNALFKFPDLFDPNDPVELPIITNMIQDDNDQFIQLFEEEDAMDEIKEEEEQIDNQPENPSNLKEFALQTLQRGNYLQSRQKNLKERYNKVFERIDNAKLKHFDLCTKLRDAKNRMTQQIRQIYDILGVADEYVGKIIKITEKYEDINNFIDDVYCDDDVINDEQEREFQDYHFFERLENIEKKLFDNDNSG